MAAQSSPSLAARHHPGRDATFTISSKRCQLGFTSELLAKRFRYIVDGLGVDCVWFAKDESEWEFQHWAFWPAEGLGQEELTRYERRHIAYNWQAP